MSTDASIPASAPSPAPRTKNVLKTLEIVALHNWITDHAADCRVTPDTQLAQIAAIELGFPITTANFSGMREEIGIAKAKKATPPTLEERVTLLEQQTAGMTTNHANLSALIIDLRLRIDAITPHPSQPLQPPYPDTGTIDLPLELGKASPQ
jgi:hypothetical protein